MNIIVYKYYYKLLNIIYSKIFYIDDWIKKIWYTYYIYMYTQHNTYIHTYIHTYIRTKEYYSAMKKGILPFAVMKMDFISLILSEISQTEKYCMISPICEI